MKVKFKDGTIKTCSAPTEQKIFKNIKDETGKTVLTPSGWITLFSLSGGITSDEADCILTSENIDALEFFAENTETGEDVKLFELNGYTKVSAATIRHSEAEDGAYTEIQLTKDI